MSDKDKPDILKIIAAANFDKAKKIIKDSKNVNGSGNADWVLDEKDLEAAGKKS